MRGRLKKLSVGALSQQPLSSAGGTTVNQVCSMSWLEREQHCLKSSKSDT
jgi:hypothetical protein